MRLGEAEGGSAGAGRVRLARTKIRVKTEENRDVGRNGIGEKLETFAWRAPLRLQRLRRPVQERHRPLARRDGHRPSPRDGWLSPWC